MAERLRGLLQLRGREDRVALFVELEVRICVSVVKLWSISGQAMVSPRSEPEQMCEGKLCGQRLNHELG